MKKIVLLAVACTMFIGWSSSIQAQSCEDILRPFYMLNNIDPNEYPEGKADWRCQFARTAFYMCDKIPEGAPVYDISEVTDLIARRHLDGNFKVNLEEMSYYAYNFLDFQQKNDKRTVYFRLNDNNNYKYLAVRSMIEMYDRTDHPERYGR